MSTHLPGFLVIFSFILVKLATSSIKVKKYFYHDFGTLMLRSCLMDFNAVCLFPEKILKYYLQILNKGSYFFNEH